MATAGSRSPWSMILLLLGLLIPLLYSSYTKGTLQLRTPIQQYAKGFRYGEVRSPIPQGTAITLDQQKTEEAARLSQTLQRESAKWDSNHPRWRLLDGLKGYQQYGEGRSKELNSWRSKYKKLDQKQRLFIDHKIDYTGKLNKVEELMARNAEIAEAILEHGLQFYGVERKELDDFVHETQNATSNQKTTVMYALKHLVRDWTHEGRHERDPTFPCILEALRKEFPTDSAVEARPRVLVPSAGLGRLAHEIAAMGDLDAVSNEWSAAMNLAYRWATSLTTANTTTIYPNVDWWSHRTTTASLTRGVQFPDNADLLSQPSVVLAEGDFTTTLKLYYGTFDAVVTLFFIDTARNIFTYLETIHALLKSGGVWINFGPLLYGSNPSLQLSLDEVIALAEELGLQIEMPGESCGSPTKSDERLRSLIVPYNADTESLSRNAYLAQHWVARKVR